MFLNVMKPGDTFGEIALLDGNQKNRHCECQRTVRTDDHHAGAFSRFGCSASPRLQSICCSFSAAHSLDKRLGGRLRIACSAGAASASTIEFGKLHGHDTKSGIQLIISQGEVARFLGLPGKSSTSTFKIGKREMDRSWSRQDDYCR